MYIQIMVATSISLSLLGTVQVFTIEQNIEGVLETLNDASRCDRDAGGACTKHGVVLSKVKRRRGYWGTCRNGASRRKYKVKEFWLCRASGLLIDYQVISTQGENTNVQTDSSNTMPYIFDGMVSRLAAIRDVGGAVDRTGLSSLIPE